MQIQKINDTSFKAIRLASVEASSKGVYNQFDLYKATERDFPFLEKLASQINLKELKSHMRD